VGGVEEAEMTKVGGRALQISPNPGIFTSFVLSGPIANFLSDKLHMKEIGMSVAGLLLLALSVSMDNFAVSLGIGTAQPSLAVRPMLRLALTFGIFQAVMPLLGWLGGMQAAFLFRGYESWILCGALVFVGWRMLRSTEESDQAQRSNLLSVSAVLSLGLATSIDSLVVGFGLAMIHVNIIQAAVVIGAVTVFVSFAGMLFGAQLGRALARHSKFSGGLVLLLIGVGQLVAR
jgi:putative Mn2+ efflux pump MntP